MGWELHRFIFWSVYRCLSRRTSLLANPWRICPWSLLGFLVVLFFYFQNGLRKYSLVQARDLVRGKYDDQKQVGEVAHFQALTTALSATVGLGNIAGVAIAIGTGGPGAHFG